MTSPIDRIRQLDVTLYQHVLSQSTEGDKQSLLALQSAMAEANPGYTCLEIGSYKGGSLQPHVVDPRCQKIFSIDPRPYTLPDTRGTERYPGNSTAGMIENLRKIPGADVEKIQTFEAGTDTLKPESIPAAPDFCFIDGEHTDAAALRDARFCLSVVKPDGCIAFHDANLIYFGLEEFLGDLGKSGRAFRPYVLPDTVFVIEFGASRLGEMEPVRTLRAQNHRAYLASLKANDWYRIAYHHPIYKMLRRIRRLFPRFKP